MKITPQLLKKYDEGKCTQEERKAVEHWLDTTEGEQSDYSRSYVLKIKDRIWDYLSEDMRQTDRKKTISLQKLVIRYAAAAVILLVAGTFVYQYSDVVFGYEASHEVALKTFQTQRGEKRTLTLSDGSVVHMNYETELRAPALFEGDERIVYLTGQAHFEVARDTNHPFIVYTEDSKTQVLGTSFGINTNVDGATEIIVTSGKVAFSDKANAENFVTLTINDRALLDVSKEISTDVVNAPMLTAWKDNQLIFEAKTLKEIITILEPWYDVKFAVQRSDLLDEDFSFALDNPALSLVLDELSFVAGFDYTIEGQKVTLF